MSSSQVEDVKFVRDIPGRITNWVRRLLDEGELWLVLGCLMTAGGAASVLRWLEYDAAVRAELIKEATSGLEQPIEPRDDLPYPGIQVLVTSAAQKILKAEHRQGSDAAFRAQMIRSNFSAIAGSGDKSTGPEQTILRRILSIGGFGSSAAELRDHFELVGSLNKKTELDIFEVLRIAKCDRGVGGSAIYYWCSENSGHKIVTVIPAQVSSAKELEFFAKDMPALNPRVAGQLVTSLALDIAVRLAVEDKVGDLDPLQRLVQVYFISPDSVLRLWSHNSSDMILDVPGTKLWAQSSYARRMWDLSREEISTLPYLDLGGNGIVETTCDRVRRFKDGKEQILGIICTDLALTDSAIELLGDELSKASLVKIKSLSAEELKNNYSTAEIHRVEKDGKVEFFIPSGSRTSRVAGWIATPSVPGTLVLPLIFSLLVTFGSMSILMFSFSRKRKINNMRIQASLRASLPVGYVETDHLSGRFGRIVYINDRGRELMGISIDRASEPFGQYFDVFIRDFNGRYEVIDEEQLYSRRIRGEISEYYAKLREKNGGRWIRLLGNTIIPSDRSLRSFGVIQPVDISVEKSLNSVRLVPRGVV